jgi:hypothetical protein
MGEGQPTGFRPGAPAPDAMVRWPADFGSRFMVCVDTEESFDWTGPFDRDARDCAALSALPEMHARFRARGVAVNYLIDHPVTTWSGAREIMAALTEDGVSAVGTQLHPWVSPPFEEEVCVHNSFAGNLPKSLEAAKLAQLTEAIEDVCGVRPVMYRAGRYGLGHDTLGLLTDLGYRIDSSMRSRYDYSAQGGPDYSAIPNHAFRTGPGGALVEIPFTTIFTGALRRQGNGLYRTLGGIPRARGIASRLGLLARVALTPEDMPLEEALEAVRVALGEGLPLLNFAYHSPSLVPGNTPYVRDQADLSAFLRWWDEVLDLLEARGARPVSQNALIAAACG